MQEGVGTAAEVRGSRSDPAAGWIIVAEPGDVVLHQHAPRVHVDLQNLQLMIVADEGYVDLSSRNKKFMARGRLVYVVSW